MYACMDVYDILMCITTLACTGVCLVSCFVYNVGMNGIHVCVCIVCMCVHCVDVCMHVCVCLCVCVCV